MNVRAAVRAVMLAVMFLITPAVFATASQSGSYQFDILIDEAKAAMLPNPDAAIAKATAAKAIAGQQALSKRRIIMEATADWLRGEAFARLNDMAAARPIIAQALLRAVRVAPNSKLHADLLLSSGSIQSAVTNVAQSLSDYQSAYVIFVKIGEERSQSKSLQAIAALYGSANDYETALKYYNQALASYKSDPKLLLALYNNRANELRELRRYPEAERQYQEALALAEQLDSPLLRATVLGNIAETRLAAGNVAGADRAIAAGMAIATRNDVAGYQKWLYGIAARAAYQHRDYARATTLIERRFAGEDFAKSELLDREAHQTAFDIYRATGRDDLALTHLATLKRLDDEATKLARSTNAALMGARFDFANQELKIAKLHQDELQRTVAFEQDRARTQRIAFLGAAVAAIVIMGMLLFALFTSRRAREKVQGANADLAVTNTALGKALAAKTEFLATTSHEIRTPLNGILGMTQVMLADTRLGGDTRDRLTVVHDAGVTMRALVDDILDVAKMETGNLTIEKAPFDLAFAIGESTRLWEDQAAAKGVDFVRDLVDCPRMIHGDAARVRQIVFNLLSNALKFTSAGTVTLAIRVDGDHYRIVVSDTGVGIAADKCEAIFESFRQADTSTTRQFGGTGLGLSICRNLARAMGGDVAVSSEEGTGSTFTVELPLLPADGAGTGSSPTAAGATPALLIVDRNPITRAMLKTWLAPHVGAIELAGSVEDAIARIGRGGIADVLVDAAVVGTDHGTALRALVAASGDMAVNLLWPAADGAAHDALLALGIRRIIAKPVSGAALVATLFGSSDERVNTPLVSQAA